MIPVISIGSLKTSGTSTLALTLAAVAAAADIPVVLVDASRDGDLVAWAKAGNVPERISVERAGDLVAIERHVRAARRRGDAAIIDAGDEEDTIRAAACLADRALIPVRFSPLSAYSALVTDQLLTADQGIGRSGRDWCFVASAITMIPSRIARAVEGIVETSRTRRLQVGLSQRAAYEAPFLNGGTIFTMADSAAPGLDRARAEAASLAYEVGILGPSFETAAPPRSEPETQIAVAA